MLPLLPLLLLVCYLPPQELIFSPGSNGTVYVVVTNANPSPTVLPGFDFDVIAGPGSSTNFSEVSLGNYIFDD